MPKLKILSGKDLIEIFKSFEFSIIGQRGSHVKLGRHLSNTRQTLTIPITPRDMVTKIKELLSVN